MPRAAAIVNGVLRMINISVEVQYDETIVVPQEGYASGSVLVLPDEGVYTDLDLRVFLNGQFLEEGIDYEYVGSAPRTKIKLSRDLYSGDRLRLRVVGSPSQIYDEVVVVPKGGYEPGAVLSLPEGREFADSELEIYLNGQYLEPLVDYNYVGLVPRTQIELIIEVFENERIRFRIDP